MSKFYEKRGYKNFMAKLYGIGASVVLVGALFKLTHMPLFGWTGAANFMLTLGLLTEAVIFFFSAFEPPHVEPDWSLVFPEFAYAYHGVETDPSKRTTLNGKNNSSDNFNQILESANLDQEALKKFGAGINKLGETASQLADLSGAVAATNEYTKVMRKATDSVAALEVQLQTAESVAETNKKFNATMAQYIEKVNASATTQEALNHQMTDLSKRMTAMNTVYGNMLSAMNYKA